jgi:hypothetical protein
VVRVGEPKQRLAQGREAARHAVGLAVARAPVWVVIPDRDDTDVTHANHDLQRCT